MSLIDWKKFCTYLPNSCTVLLSDIPSKKISQLRIVALLPFQIQIFTFCFNTEPCRVLLGCQMSFTLTTFCIGLSYLNLCPVSINKSSQYRVRQQNARCWRPDEGNCFLTELISMIMISILEMKFSRNIFLLVLHVAVFKFAWAFLGSVCVKYLDFVHLYVLSLCILSCFLHSLLPCFLSNSRV